MGHWMQDGTWSMAGGYNMIMMAIIWILVMAASVWVVRSLSERPLRRAGPHTPEMPLGILQRRYASGDIGRDEYEQKRVDLTGQSTRGDDDGARLRDNQLNRRD